MSNPMATEGDHPAEVQEHLSASLGNERQTRARDTAFEVGSGFSAQARQHFKEGANRISCSK